MKYYFLLCILSISTISKSQNAQREFGSIEQTERKMTAYAKDPEAEAVVLFDIGKSKFVDGESGYDIQFTRHKRLKIFKTSAKEYAEITIPYYVDGYGKTEKIHSIRAMTYNDVDGFLEGVELEPSTIYEEQLSSRWRTKKFIFPNVQKGSIIEYSYIHDTPFLFNLPDWSFQDKIPTIYSEYEVRMIPFYEYAFIAQGISRFSHQTSVIEDKKRQWGNVVETRGKNVGTGIEFQDYIHTYGMKDVPAFKDESYITSIDDYIMKMDFQLAKIHLPSGGTKDIMSTWPGLNSALLKNERFGKYLKSCNSMAKKLIEKELSLEGLPKLEKAQIIIEYVKSNFSWNGFNSKYSTESSKKFFENKSGNTAEINLFMIALLNAAEISAKPIILSTRGHGKIRLDYPFDHFTNYVIALVETEKPFFADGTDSYLPYNRIPIKCFNEIGLLVNKDEDPTWFNLENQISSIKNYTLRITPDVNLGTSKAEVTFQSTEFSAQNLRQTFKNEIGDIKDYYENKIGEINNLKTLNYRKSQRPYQISIQANPKLEQLGENLIVNPFLGLSIADNELTQEKRNYPVDFVYPTRELYKVIVEIPQGYKINYLPRPFDVSDELAAINLNYNQSNQTLSIDGFYEFKKSIYQKNDYQAIRGHLDEVVKRFNQEIVFSPK